MRVAIVGHADCDSAPDGTVRTLLRCLTRADADCALIWITRASSAAEPPPIWHGDIHYLYSQAGSVVPPHMGLMQIAERAAPILNGFDIVYSEASRFPALQAILQRSAAPMRRPYFVTILDQSSDRVDRTGLDVLTCGQPGAICQWIHSDCVVRVGQGGVFNRLEFPWRTDEKVIAGDAVSWLGLHRQAEAAALARHTHGDTLEAEMLGIGPRSSEAMCRRGFGCAPTPAGLPTTAQGKQALVWKLPGSSAFTTDVSFVVCSRNRSRALICCLKSISLAISRSRDLDAEMVVVDNNSTDDTGALLDTWCARTDLKVKVVHQALGGVAASKNAGIRAASGRLLVFIDDDCRVDPKYLSDLWAHFRFDQSPVIRGGRVELGDAGDLPLTVKKDDLPAELIGLRELGTIVLGCNMVVDRRALDIVGGFDERFGPGARFEAGEDVEFLYRAQRRGIRIFYVPDMTVRHHHGRRTPIEARQLLRRYFIGAGAIYGKHSADRLLMRNLYLDMKSATKELFGGPMLHPQYGISNSFLIAMNLRGMLLYFIQELTSTFRHRDRRAPESAAST